MNNRWWIVAASVVGTVLFACILMVILVYSGAYNVAASAGHSAFGRWLFDTTMENSVRARADEQGPARFTPDQIRLGAHEFKETCEHCHGGPGVKPHEWTKGMTPNPPDLRWAARHWSAAQIHWIVEHGIKMTAMPAFGPTHDERKLWAITGFILQLPSMSPRAYAALGRAEEAHEHEHGGEHGDTGGG